MKLAPKVTLVSSMILLLLLFTTDPQRLPSVLLIAPFVLLFAVVASGLPAIFEMYGVAWRRSARVGAMAAAVLVLLLVLQSLGQLTVRDTLAAALLIGVAYFYMSRFGVRSMG